MSLRLPRNPTGGSEARSRSNIEEAVVAEKAVSLGVAGRRLEKALAALHAAGDAEREALTDEAAGRVWAFLIQRELCGLRDRDGVISEYAIPARVLAGAGARRHGS